MRSVTVTRAARKDAVVTADAASTAGAPEGRGRARPVQITVLGLVVLLVGGSLFVDAAVHVAPTLGLSDRVVG